MTPKTYVRIDLGFGDIVKAIDYPVNLSSTKKGPLFESTITLRCYPKEFIFAEKLETVLFRGESNSRMKDFHDLYSLIKFGKLSHKNTEEAIKLVFNHRNTSFKELPIRFKQTGLEQLEKGWSLYFRRLSPKSSTVLPPFLEQVIADLNEWLAQSTSLIK
nr:nucleotidyl transferase AbiEii/AbiGii toxin family protein [Candidatus Neptunochlamydia vexilliferae]